MSVKTPTKTKVKVIKKDGRLVDFKIQKIQLDLESAERVFLLEFKRPIQELLDDIERGVNATFKKQGYVESKQIFSIVEEVLESEPAVLAAFREYKRIQQTELDNAQDIKHQINLLEQEDPDVTKENGNKDETLMSTKRELLAGVVHKAKGLQMLPESVKRAHFKGRIHFHDLDHSPYSGKPNCCLVDFPYMFEHGFHLGDAFIEPPKSLKVAGVLIPQVISAITSAQYGGISVHEIDKLLAPYAEKSYNKYLKQIEGNDLTDEQANEIAKTLTLKEIQDTAQGLEYQINTLSTSSSQVPFTSFSLGLGTSWYERELQKAILKVRYDGQANGKTNVFPKLLYFDQDGVNLKQGDPNYDIKKLAIKTSARRTYPDMISMKMMGEVKPHTNQQYVKEHPGELEPITPMGK